MAEKSIIGIGIGLAGLATGCYAQMNGYKTRIFEMQSKPGGVRLMEAEGLHLRLRNSQRFLALPPNSVNNHLRKELGALRDLKTYSFKEFVQVEDVNGKIFNLHELKKRMEDLSPNNKGLIDDFTKAAHKFSGYDLFASLSGGFGTKVKIAAAIGLANEV